MANKYVDVSATYNGDGTASNQAASAGAVGAWNNLLNCFKGTPGYGAVAAGDNVYVRCPIGTTTLSVTGAASCTFSTTPTRANPITWIFDSGVIWNGDTGTIKVQLDSASSSNIVTFKPFHQFNAIGYNLIFESTYNGNQNAWAGGNNILFTGVKFLSKVINSGNGLHYWSDTFMYFIDCLFCIYGGHASIPYFFGTAGTKSVFTNCEFDLNPNSAVTINIFDATQASKVVELIGGRITNSITTQSLCYTNAFTGNDYPFTLLGNGFDPGAVKLASSENAPSYGLSRALISLTGISSQKYGALIWRNNGFTCWGDPSGSDSRGWTGGYPTLNATLPDVTNTHWSWRVSPLYACPGYPYEFPPITKIYTDSAAIKTITTHLLIKDSFTSPQNDEWWVDINYVDNSTGLTKRITSKAAGAMSAGDMWSASTYGSNAYTPRKIVVTTPTSVKQGSLINIQLYSTRPPSVAATDFYFVCPDPVIS